MSATRLRNGYQFWADEPAVIVLEREPRVHHFLTSAQTRKRETEAEFAVAVRPDAFDLRNGIEHASAKTSYSAR